MRWVTLRRVGSAGQYGHEAEDSSVGANRDRLLWLDESEPEVKWQDLLLQVIPMPAWASRPITLLFFGRGEAEEMSVFWEALACYLGRLTASHAGKAALTLIVANHGPPGALEIGSQCGNDSLLGVDETESAVRGYQRW